MNVTLRKGDNRELIKGLSDNSIDAIVTDPPYGLSNEPDALEMLRDWLVTGYHEVKGRGFMGKGWDAFVPQPNFWKECYRVLKPGGYILSFGGTRTFDLVALGLRIAGFEYRDTIMWVYGSGFVKGHDVSKAIYKKAGAKTEVVSTTDLATPEAKQWDGWNVNLTPAHEPILMFRKPLEGTYVENVLKWGTGAINIKACRIPISDDAKMARNNKKGDNGWKNSSGGKNSAALNGEPSGRWAKNFIHDGSDEVVELFPVTTSGKPGTRRKQHETNSMSGRLKMLGRTETGYGDSGSAARFFYCAKVSKQERNAGLDGLPMRQYSHDGKGTEIENPYQRNKSVSTNPHPTVKPIALMKYLVRLVTPPGGIVLDPFMGSGSTGCATVLEGFDFIGYELDSDELNMLEVAERRIEYWRKTVWVDEEESDNNTAMVIVDKNDYSNLPMFEVME